MPSKYLHTFVKYHELRGTVIGGQDIGAALYAEGFVVRRTKRSWDYGCDLLAKRGANTVLVQVKQVRSDKILTVGVEEILKAQERYKSHNPTALALITNAKKLSSAQCVLAGKNDVVILTAEEVANYGAALIGLAPTIYRMSQPADQQSDG